MSTNKYNPFKTAQSYFDNIASILAIDKPTRDLLRNPMKEYHITIPIKMDDGTFRVFKGFRIQHNTARGPAKGGIRFHPEETADTIRAHAMLVTWKSAVVDIPLGGSKGGIICDPHNLSLNEQEKICRGWVRQLADVLGPNKDIPAPDLMTNSQHMAWMLDEYEKITGQHFPGFITGKPIGLGGSLGRNEATGYGVVFTIREALKHLNLKFANITASIQGFGNVAQSAVKLFTQMGGKVICVSSWDQNEHISYAFRKKDGIKFEELYNITDRFGGISKDKAEDLGYEVLPGEDWIKQDVDILIPAALESQIYRENAEIISKKVKIIVEAANAPTTDEADKLLTSRNIMIIPDFLANSGGLTCSYFEQVQSNMNYYWEEDEIFAKLDLKITSAFHDVYRLAQKKKLNLRDSAYVIAVNRVMRACKDRGWI